MQLPGFASSAMHGTLLSPIDIPISLKTRRSFPRLSSQDIWKCHNTVFTPGCWDIFCLWPWSTTDVAWRNLHKEASNSLKLSNMGFTLCIGLCFLSSENPLYVLFAQKTASLLLIQLNPWLQLAAWREKKGGIWAPHIAVALFWLPFHMIFLL